MHIPGLSDTNHFISAKQARPVNKCKVWLLYSVQDKVHNNDMDIIDILLF
jgi:hypothetical protein